VEIERKLYYRKGKLWRKIEPLRRVQKEVEEDQKRKKEKHNTGVAPLRDPVSSEKKTMKEVDKPTRGSALKEPRSSLYLSQPKKERKEGEARKRKKRRKKTLQRAVFDRRQGGEEKTLGAGPPCLSRWDEVVFHLVRRGMTIKSGHHPPSHRQRNREKNQGGGKRDDPAQKTQPSVGKKNPDRQRRARKGDQRAQRPKKKSVAAQSRLAR